MVLFGSNRHLVQTGTWSHVIPAGDGAVAWDLWLQGPSQKGFCFFVPPPIDSSPTHMPLLE